MSSDQAAPKKLIKPKSIADIQPNNAHLIDFDRIKVRIIVICSNAEKQEALGTFLTRRGWDALVTDRVGEALSALSAEKYDFVLISVNHPNPKIRHLPGIVNLTFNVPVILFGELTDARTINAMQAINANYKMLGIISGTMVQRRIKQILQEMFKSQDFHEVKLAEGESLVWKMVNGNEATALKQDPISKALASVDIGSIRRALNVDTLEKEDPKKKDTGSGFTFGSGDRAVQKDKKKSWADRLAGGEESGSERKGKNKFWLQDGGEEEGAGRTEDADNASEEMGSARSKKKSGYTLLEGEASGRAEPKLEEGFLADDENKNPSELLGEAEGFSTEEEMIDENGEPYVRKNKANWTMSAEDAPEAGPQEEDYDYEEEVKRSPKPRVMQEKADEDYSGYESVANYQDSEENIREEGSAVPEELQEKFDKDELKNIKNHLQAKKAAEETRKRTDDREEELPQAGKGESSLVDKISAKVPKKLKNLMKGWFSKAEDDDAAADSAKLKVHDAASEDGDMSIVADEDALGSGKIKAVTDAKGPTGDIIKKKIKKHKADQHWSESDEEESDAELIESKKPRAQRNQFDTDQKMSDEDFEIQGFAKKKSQIKETATDEQSKILAKNADEFNDKSLQDDEAFDAIRSAKKQNENRKFDWSSSKTNKPTDEDELAKILKNLVRALAKMTPPHPKNISAVMRVGGVAVRYGGASGIAIFAAQTDENLTALFRRLCVGLWDKSNEKEDRLEIGMESIAPIPFADFFNFENPPPGISVVAESSAGLIGLHYLPDSGAMSVAECSKWKELLRVSPEVIGANLEVNFDVQTYLKKNDKYVKVLAPGNKFSAAQVERFGRHNTDLLIEPASRRSFEIHAFANKVFEIVDKAKNKKAA